MNPQDNPLFTAYALGELSAEEARELHELLATNPVAAHELEQIEAVTDALRHGAPIPQSRLTHEQRHAVLHPAQAQMPRLVQPLRPQAKPAPRRPSTFWPVMQVVLKSAAAVAVTGSAFLAGWWFHPVVQEAAQIAATPAKSSTAPQTVSGQSSTPRSQVPQSVKSGDVGAPEQPSLAMEAESLPAVQQEAPALSVPSRPEVEVVSAPAEKAKPQASVQVAAVAEPKAVASGQALNLGFTVAAGTETFASTTKRAADQFNLRPSLIKPAPVKAQGTALSAPLPASAKTAETARLPRSPELFIHSWKSEVSACPWNPTHRLLRISVQLPANQASVTSMNDASFPLHVNFDPANVRQYRMLGERHVNAGDLNSAGSQVLWYEYQPNGDLNVPRDRLIATLTLPNVRFTSQTVGPFDSSKLQVIDRGYTLKNARDEFVFETAVLGFGMLLRGTDNIGSLNHNLVLDLARQSRVPDETGERARFVRLVQEAQRLTGL